MQCELRTRRCWAGLLHASGVSLLPLVFLSTSIFGQQVTGGLQAIILDSLDQPVPLVNVTVSGPHLQGVRGAVTDTDGFFTLMALSPGAVSVRLSHVNYQVLTLEEVPIRLGKTTSLGKVHLHPRLHELESVIIVGSRPLIDPGATSMGANLHVSEFERLPVERTYRSIAALIPQVNASFFGDEVNIGGATGSENRYFVDGVDVTDPNFGMTGTSLPYNFVKEIEVMTGGYQAEARSALGGLVNVITPSGGNEIHGSVFGFHTSNRLSGPRRVGLLDPTQGAFSNSDIGFGIGGPIVRDKLWFYLAYNPNFNRRDVVMPGIGVAVDKTVTHAFAGKLSWRVSDRVDVVVTSTGDPSERDAIGYAPPMTPNPARIENPDPYLSFHREGGANLSVNASFVAGPFTLLEASLSRISRNWTFEASSAKGRSEILFIDTKAASWSGGSFGNVSVFRTGTTARFTATMLMGPHALKAGIEYRDNGVEAELDFPNSLSYVNDSLYVLTLNGTHGTVHNRIPTLFVQDTWRPSDWLQFHAGIRWDGQFVIGGNGKLAQKVIGPIQPRLGVTVAPDDEGKEKIFAWFGRYIQEWHTAVMTGAYTGTGYFYEIHFARDPRSGGITGDTVNNTPARIQPEERGLKAQHYDEFCLGYQRMIGDHSKISLEGVYRTLGEAMVAGFVQGGLQLGNPGKGALSAFPRAKRYYRALVLALELTTPDRWKFAGSYTLSRSSGNYEGLYDSHSRNIVPNVNFTFADPTSLGNSMGPLPNDRTHVLKFSGSYRIEPGFTAGISFLFATGTPLSELAGLGKFVKPRGTSGRTPSIWDLNVRFVYPTRISDGMEARLILDLLHIASQREAVDFVQTRFFAVDSAGKPVGENPAFGVPYRYQPSMSVRLGMEVCF